MARTPTGLILASLFAAGGYLLAGFVETRMVWDEDVGLGVQPPDAALKDVLAMIAESSNRSSDSEPQRDAGAVPASVAEEDSAIRFIAAAATGVEFTYNNGGGNFHLAETLGGGVGAADFDRDGLPDLVFVDGGDPIQWPEEFRTGIVLYRQCQQMKFDVVSKQACLHWSGYGHGVSVGDFDNDGFVDLVASGYQSLVMYRNLGDGTFEETGPSADKAANHVYATTSFGDLDGDGDLDLYVTGYADVPRSLPTPWCEEGGIRIHCHPHHFPVISDRLFENIGDGTFTDRSQSAGIAQHRQYGLGVVMVDLNHDRTPEIFVANDGDRNLLFQSAGELQFEEVATRSGVAYNGEGQSMGAMGIACADFDRNGWLDLMTTNFLHERNVIFSHAGDLLFYDRSLNTVIDTSSRRMVGWAAIPIDGDSDGYTDLFIANGHVTQSPSAPYAQMPVLHRGLPNGRWQKLGSAGAYFTQPWHGRGAVQADIDVDGLPDLVVSHIGAPASILLNRSAPVPDTEGITLTLIGVESNRSAATCRVTVITPELKQVAQRVLSSGYLSSSTCSMHFGLGTADYADQLSIVWQSGVTQTLDRVPAGAHVTVIEGQPAFVE